jgi:hypothetical protein
MQLTREQLRRLIIETKFKTKGALKSSGEAREDINAARNKKLNDALDGPLGFVGLIIELGRQGLVAVENVGLLILDEELQKDIEIIYDQDGFDAALAYVMRYIHDVE